MAPPKRDIEESETESTSSEGVEASSTTRPSTKITPSHLEEGMATGDGKMEDVFLDEDRNHMAKVDATSGGGHMCTRVLLAVAVLVFICVLIVGIACGKGGCSARSSDAEDVASAAPLEQVTEATIAPTRHPEEAEGIREVIEDLMGDDHFEQSGEDKPTFIQVARRLALEWITHEDPARLQPSSDGVSRVQQRYLLALFYYQTTRNTEWDECNPPKGKESDLCFRPAKLYFAGKPTSVWGHRWLTDYHECLWAGVLCQGEDKNVTSLALPFNDLNGPLAWEITKLSHLRQVTLGDNYLTGTIPTSLGDLYHLESINLSKNRLSGTIPTELFGVTPTKHVSWPALALSSNQLTGSIPTEVGLFHGVRLSFADNDLSGAIPSELFQLTDLTSMGLFRNPKITGAIPTEIGLLSNVHYLLLDDIGLTGTLPSEMGMMSSLADFSMVRTKVSGSIPEEMYDGTPMRFFDVADSQLTGTISPSIGKWNNLRWFKIANNDFSGSIPEEFWSLTGMYNISMEGNMNLAGTVPDEFCGAIHENPDLRVDFVADCHPDAGSIDCPSGCCTSCCDPRIRVCTPS